MASTPPRLKRWDDLPNPLVGGASGAVGDLPVYQTAPGEQNDPRVAAVDGVGSLTFQAVQLRAFPRAQLPCRDLVHDGFSDVMVVASTTAENPMRNIHLKPKRL